MKKNNNIFLLLAAFMLLFAACDVDNERGIYTPDSIEAGFYHDSQSVILLPVDRAILVDIYRNSNVGSTTVNLSSDDATGLFTVPADVTFADGEYKTQISVAVSPDVEMAKKYTVNITLPNAPLSMKQKVKLNIEKDYDWVSIGEGLYRDVFMFDNAYKVEIMKGQGFDVYRIMDPYSEGLKAEEYGAYGGTPAEYVQVEIAADKSAYFKPAACGYLYQASASQMTYIYHPSAFTGMDTSNNKQIDEFTIQLEANYYIPALKGGFGLNLITIYLPGSPNIQ